MRSTTSSAVRGLAAVALLLFTSPFLAGAFFAASAGVSQAAGALDALQSDNVHPYIVSIRGGSGGPHICSGALVSPNVVLTSANCVLETGDGAVVRVGGFCSFCPPDYKEYKADFRHYNTTYGFGLLRLAESIEDTSAFVELGEDPLGPTSENLELAGWGKTFAWNQDLIPFSVSVHVSSEWTGRCTSLQPYEVCLTLGSLPCHANGGGAVIQNSGTATPKIVALAVDFFLGCNEGANWIMGVSISHIKNLVTFLTKEASPDAQPFTIAGGSSGSFNGMGGDASFNTPSGLAHNGNILYVADTGNQLIRALDITNQQVSTLKDLAYLNFEPAALVFSSENSNIYVTGNHRVLSVSVPSGYVENVAGSMVPGVAADSAVSGANARFNNLGGIAARYPFFYVADTNNDCLRMLDVANDKVTKLTAAVVKPSHIFFQHDVSTNLYVTDTHRVLMVDILSHEVVDVLAGTSNFGVIDGIGDDARFQNPAGMAYFGGYLYVADSLGKELRRLNLDTMAVKTVQLSSASGFMGTDSTLIYNPMDLETMSGALYMVDARLNTITRLSLAALTLGEDELNGMSLGQAGGPWQSLSAAVAVPAPAPGPFLPGFFGRRRLRGGTQ